MHRTSDRSHGGLSLQVDAALAALMVPGREREQWRDTVISYHTMATHFGGDWYEYPAVMKCPWTEQDVFRWTDYWDENNHPGTSQVQTYEVIKTPIEGATTAKLDKRLVQVLHIRIMTSLYVLLYSIHLIRNCGWL